jgi:hypothetical protein
LDISSIFGRGDVAKIDWSKHKWLMCLSSRCISSNILEVIINGRFEVGCHGKDKVDPSARVSIRPSGWQSRLQPLFSLKYVWGENNLTPAEGMALFRMVLSLPSWSCIVHSTIPDPETLMELMEI